MLKKVSKLLLLSLFLLSLSCETNNEALELENNVEISKKAIESKSELLLKDSSSKEALSKEISSEAVLAYPTIPNMEYANIKLIRPPYVNDPKFLSTTRNGDIVDLYPIDDRSGRQRWNVNYINDPTDVEGGYYYITIYSGVRPRRKAFLSTTRDGGKIDLHDRDDGSGRQRWRISNILPGGGREIRLVGGVVPQNSTLLVRHKVGNNYTNHLYLRENGNIYDSRWDIF